MADEGKKEVEEVTRKALEKGGVLAKLYFDMESEKQEELQPLMVDLINNRLLKSPGVLYCFGGIDEPVKLKDTYSTSAEVTALFEGIWPVIRVMFDFTPAAVEVIKPQKDIVLKPSDLQALLLNVAQVSMDYSNYILSRVLKKEDYDKIMQQMKNREELGKRLLDKKGQQGEGKR
jgi:hypothetical protein